MAFDKEKALDTALAQIEKQFGKGSVMRMGAKQTMKVDFISTGSLSLDIALGIGGLPRGRIIEIFGPESSGKTTLSLHCIAEAQKQGGTVAFIDVEHALDPVYAAALGVNVDELLVSQPDTGEQALEITEALVRSCAIDAIVIDSVAALVPKAEIEGEMGDTHVGLQARLMSQALRKLTSAISKSNCVAIFINQLREKVGVMFGSPEVTPGGRALKFYSSVRIDIRKGDPIKVDGEVIGSHTKVKVVKNKIAPPFKEAEFDIMYGKGISKEGEIVDLGVRADVLKKSGAWFSYGDRRLAQGRDKVKDLIKNDPALAAEIEAKIMANVDHLAPISKSSKYSKGKSKKEAIAEAQAEAEAEADSDYEESQLSDAEAEEAYDEMQTDIAEMPPEEMPPANEKKNSSKKKKTLDIESE